MYQMSGFIWDWKWNEIGLDDKILDWFVFTDKGCHVVEYFGLYVEREGSSRIDDYRKRTDNKLEKYKELNGYKFMFLYPNDLKNNFEGVYKKLETII